jgi:hypothetical protein
MLAPSARFALVAAVLAHSVHAQKPGATGTVVSGRVVVQVFVRLSDEETMYAPVAGLGLGFLRSPQDTAMAVTDASGSAIILLSPGKYRLVSLAPTRWKGATYTWSVPVVVQPFMSYIDLRRKEATVLGARATVAPPAGSRVQPAIDPPQVLSTFAQQASTATTPAGAYVPATYTPVVSGLVAQSGLERSRSAGFYAGLGLEGDGIAANESGSTTESGAGVGLVLGYSFSKRFSLYGELSAARMEMADGGGTYALGHVDLGTRVHFRAGPNILVPFLQFGLSRRAVAADFGNLSSSASGGGFSFGGGLNTHISPSAAFSTVVTWTIGNLDQVQVGTWTSTGYSINMTSARLQLGMVWFPN